MSERHGNGTGVVSIVATTRNDDHGGNMRRRMQLFVDCLDALCERHRVPLELVLVEWNPPADRAPLAEVLTWARGPRWCGVRLVTVPPETHDRLRHSDGLPLFQMIAKNVGIRRARGEFVLATNVDILFGEELVQFLGSGQLREGRLYRVVRYDVPGDPPEGSLADDAPVDGLLGWCKDNVLRVCSREGMVDVRTGERLVIYGPWICRARLHTNGCGDFQLMAARHWHELRGYPEIETYSMHLDSVLTYMAHFGGAPEEVLVDPMRIYHLEHTGGWQPSEGKTRRLETHLKRSGVPQLAASAFNAWALAMTESKRPIIFNDENWGMAGEAFDEQEVVRPSWAAAESAPVAQRADELGVVSAQAPKDTPRLSVVVPCLDRINDVRRTLASILSQDYPEIECLVVDRGSTDGTLEAIETEHGDRVQRVATPGLGEAEAVNAGWQRAAGEIVAWLGPDDAWWPSAARQAVAHLSAHPEIDVLYGDCATTDERGELTGIAHMHEWDLRYSVEHCDHCVPRPAAFIRRRILDEVGWLDPSFGHKADHELWLRIGQAGTIRHVPRMFASTSAVPADTGYRGDLTAQHCVRVTRAFFEQLEDSSLFDAIHERAVSNSYLRGALYAAGAGFHWRAAFQYVLRAIEIDPSNARRVLARLNRQLVKPPVGLAVRYLERIERTSGSLALFGLTELAKRLIVEFRDRPMPYVIDNSPAKHGARFNGVEVVSLDEACTFPPDVIAITSTTSVDEIRRQIARYPELAEVTVLVPPPFIPADVVGDHELGYDAVGDVLPEDMSDEFAGEAGADWLGELTTAFDETLATGAVTAGEPVAR